ncbi:MAG: hypothetical protein IH576_01850, partial [Deltaproteobacteria bacterium]|nr:hypothetical protein [Deltaproteobacteria bacterium]
MRKGTIGLLALGIILSLCGITSAATHTISWSPVTTYTDGTAISGKTISYSVYWSTSSSLSTKTAIASGLTTTSRTFDPAALGMTAGSTVYFAMKTTLSSGEESALCGARSWVVPASAASLSSISIGGPSSVSEGSTGAFTATAAWSDATTSSVSPTWSVSTAYASINSSGTLTALSVSANQTVTVTASYASGGTTKTASKTVTVANQAPSDPASPDDIRIGKQASSPVPATWRLSWRAVTEFANGQELGAGRTVRYNAYWTRDPSLAPGNLVAIATST